MLTNKRGAIFRSQREVESPLFGIRDYMLVGHNNWYVAIRFIEAFEEETGPGSDSPVCKHALDANGGVRQLFGSC